MGSKQRLRAERRRLEGQNLSVKFSVTSDDDPQGIDVSLDPAQLNAPEPEVDGVTVDLNAPEPEPVREPEIEVETDDDDDGPDPLVELQRQYEEAKAARDAAEARAKDKEAAEARYRAEAEQARREREASDAGWREEQKRRDELETYRIRAEREQLASHKAVIEGALAGVDASAAAAEQQYAEAMASADYVAAAKAQRAIADAAVQKGKYTEGLERIQEQLDAPVQEYRREPEPQRQATQADPWESAIASYGESDKAWLRLHKDDLMASPERQGLAAAAHTLAVTRDKLVPGSPEYYRSIDLVMGYADPAPVAQNATTEEPVTEEQQPAPKPVSKRPAAAPVSRASSSSQPTKIFLTEWDREQAKQLKMSDREYATFKVKSSEGQITQAQAGGRLMARYST